MSILKRIEKPNDLKGLSIEELHVLACEIREQIINTCARTGGHVAPSLGVVELTIALYRVFDAERDKIIWDVGHQTYAQKLITGRYPRFHTLRTFKGISGFPKRKESRYDVFDTGHSSTSLSAAAGFAIARDFKGEDYRIISVIGDGSLGAGIAFEALNNLGHLKKNVLVVLNDNERSIGESVGALSQYLTRIITTRTYNRFRDDLWKFLGRMHPYFRDRGRNLAKRIEEGLKGLYAPAVIFEELGFRYIGPLNGHKLGEMIDTFSRIKDMHGPKIVHVVTKKGKGYQIAEDNPEVFHGIGPYCIASGEQKDGGKSYTSVFGDALVNLAQNNKRILAITAGMCLGTGLVRFREELPSRFFDVGINEQHAVTMAAALALDGFIPVCAVYSTFLQRAYDQIVHDVSLQEAPVIFAVDRAGLVGADGPTHHGPFDLSYFRCLPNMVISTPKNGDELVDLLYTATKYGHGPFVIRYPRESCQVDQSRQPVEIPIGSWETVVRGSKIALLAVGSMVGECIKALELTAGREVKPTLVNARYVKPMDANLVDRLMRTHDYIITVEENSVIGGFGDAILEYCAKKQEKARVVCLGIPDTYIEHGSRAELLEVAGISARHISQEITKLI